MKELEEFKLFLAFNEKRKEIAQFVQKKVQNIPNKQSIVDLNYGLFSIVKDISLDNFIKPKMFIYRPWLKYSSLSGKLHLNQRKFKKKVLWSNNLNSKNVYQNNHGLFVDNAYAMNDSVEDMKKIILEYFNIDNDLYLSVIANIFKNTYNVFDEKNQLFNLLPYYENVLDSFNHNIIVGDVLFLPVSSKKNSKIHEYALNWMLKGGSVFILEPFSSLKKDVDIENQQVYESKFGSFRVVYYSMF